MEKSSIRGSSFFERSANHDIYTFDGSLIGESMPVTCDPVFGRVDDLISLLGKSKLLHILFILNTKKRPMRFTEIKQRVDSSSTTVTRRLAELETNGLVTRVATTPFQFLLNTNSPKMHKI